MRVRRKIGGGGAVAQPPTKATAARMGLFGGASTHKPMVAKLGTMSPWVQPGLQLTWGARWSADAVKGPRPDKLLLFKAFLGWKHFADAQVAHREEMKEINDKIAEAPTNAACSDEQHAAMRAKTIRFF